MSIARDRLRSQRIEGPPLNRAVDVVRWLVASQAQDYAGAKWALGQAFEAGIVDAVENAPDADQGELRTREIPEDDVPEEYLDEDESPLECARL